MYCSSFSICAAKVSTLFWFLKSGVWGTHLSWAGSRGQGTWYGTWVPYSSEKRSGPLWSFSVVDHCSQDVISFFLGETSVCLSSLFQCFVVEVLFIQVPGPFMKRLSHMQLWICCVCRRWVQNHPMPPSWILLHNSFIILILDLLTAPLMY